MNIVPINNIGTRIRTNIPFMAVCIFPLLPKSRIALPVTEYSFDGGFSKYPYLNGNYSDIHITPSIWNKDMTNRLFPSLDIRDYTNLLSKDKFNLKELYLQGYNDAKENKEKLDHLFK